MGSWGTAPRGQSSWYLALEPGIQKTFLPLSGYQPRSSSTHFVPIQTELSQIYKRDIFVFVTNYRGPLGSVVCWGIDMKFCDDDCISKNITFLDIIHRLVFVYNVVLFVFQNATSLSSSRMWRAFPRNLGASGTVSVSEPSSRLNVHSVGHW
jgi:hypothetical protein